MAAFKPWDLIKVPFPYTDRPVRQRRPALVISAGDPLGALPESVRAPVAERLRAALYPVLGPA